MVSVDTKKRPDAYPGVISRRDIYPGGRKIQSAIWRPGCLAGPVPRDLWSGDREWLAMNPVRLIQRSFSMSIEPVGAAAIDPH
jgi:hypothetical protein